MVSRQDKNLHSTSAGGMGPERQTERPPGFILPLIVFAQFACTSVWFAGNAVVGDLVQGIGLEGPVSLGDFTSAVQLGFILGCLTYATLAIADRFSPSRVFFLSALLAAFFNLGPVAGASDWSLVLSFRFLSGFFLAGIYPVGMKIASDYFGKGLGKALGFLVGALVLGTAFPHLLRGLSLGLPWKGVLIGTSGLAVLGGLLILLLVPDGPFRKKSPGFDPRVLVKVFRNRGFRGAAFGYFGHMWELYAFWAFVPEMLALFDRLQMREAMTSFAEGEIGNPFLWSFAIIGIGGVACAVGGILAFRTGPKKVALGALAGSGLCCLLSPLAFLLPRELFLAYLLVWGVLVIADSPMFSTLVARNVAPEYRGTALTIVNSLGFAITIGSIQLLSGLIRPWSGHLSEMPDGMIWIFVVLGLGPMVGVYFGRRAG